MAALALFVTLTLVYSATSALIARTVLTAPILFMATGMIATFAVPDLHDPSLHRHTYLTLAELGLVMLLFTDASRTNLTVLARIKSLPARLLSTGMLLTLVLGGAAAMVVFGGLSIWEAGILTAVLAPTDAGLGQIIVTSETVPMRVRQALNVEAGLNDGLAVPFLLFFIGGMRKASDTASVHSDTLVHFILEQLGYGALIGIAIGLLGGGLLGLAARRRWIAAPLEQLGIVALALLCMLASDAVGASMFIAAFVAGLAVQVGFRDAGKHSVEFAENWGQIFNLGIFFLFGIVVARNLALVEVRHVIFAVLSLTVLRMLPVAIALIGARLSAATVLFMGWFGPRGLATIVLVLVYLEEDLKTPGEQTIRMAAIVTVFLSILAHGLTAMPGIRLYGRALARLPKDAAEFDEAPAIRGRS